VRRAGGLLLVLAAALVPACGGHSSSSPPPATAAITSSAHAVGTLVETFVDTSRPTVDHGSVPGAPSRTLRTTVMFPATADGGPPDTVAGPYPLVVFAHGSGGLGTEYFPMLRSWAAAGYVVAAPEFPVAAGGPDGRQGDSSSIEDLPNQPADMSFAVTQLLAASASAASPLHGMVDPTRIGAAGHSLGAMATLALTENTCCHDERLRAAVVLAGREAPFGSGVFFNRIRTPLLLVHGDADGTVPYSEGRKIYNDAPPPRYLLTLAKGGHSTMYDPFGDPAAQLVSRLTVAFFDTYLKGATDGPSRLRVDAGPSAGVAKLDSET
jgi:predicted dienelactone hydrolase